jgi:RNA polymerase sigma factor (sigma-70 family)
MTPARVQEALPDPALIARCIEGDEAAWETLVRRYANLVYAIAHRAGLAEDEAADVFQTVFVIVWRSLDLLSEPQAFPGWLATIARRESWRVSRGRARRATTVERAASDPSATVLPLRPARADEVLESVERAALVQHAVEGLDERCRELLTVLFWETPAPSYDEVAERLGMPLGSLGPTRGRCLEKLRGRLAELGFA